MAERTTRNLAYQQGMISKIKSGDTLNRLFFVYSASISNIAAGSSGSDVVNIQSDSDFIVRQISAQVLDPSTNGIMDEIDITLLVQINDLGSGASVFDAPLHVRTIAGTASLPFILPVPRLFAARSSIEVVASNPTGSNQPQSLSLALIGEKVMKA